MTTQEVKDLQEKVDKILEILSKISTENNQTSQERFKKMMESLGFRSYSDLGFWSNLDTPIPSLKSEHTVKFPGTDGRVIFYSRNPSELFDKKVFVVRLKDLEGNARNRLFADCISWNASENFEAVKRVEDHCLEFFKANQSTFEWYTIIQVSNFVLSCS